MSAAGRWRLITCEEREQLVDLLGRSYNGPAAPYGVLSSLTDLDGEYGDPVMDTTWGHTGTEVPVLRDVRWPARRYFDDDPAMPKPDARPCVHYRYEED